METILLLAHTETDGSLARPAREAVGAALALTAANAGATLVIGLIGAAVQAAADALANCGAVRCIGVSGADFAVPRYSTDAAAAEALARAAAATMVVAPANSRTNRVLAGVAQRLGGRIDAHVTGLAIGGDQPTITRWYYRQRMQADIRRTVRPWVILLEPGCSEPWSGAPGSAKVEAISVTLSDAHRRTTVTGISAPPRRSRTASPTSRKRNS
jgi:electron transfer flavoprotein alpha subunit